MSEQIPPPRKRSIFGTLISLARERWTPKVVVWVPWVLLVVLPLGACGSCQNNDAQLTRLRAIQTVDPGHRTLAELDVAKDGVIDQRDRAFFDRVAQAAREELSRRSMTTTIADGLYAGSPADAPALFSRFQRMADVSALSDWKATRLEELVIETKWLAEQARMAASVGARASTGLFGGSLASLVPGLDTTIMRPAAVCKAIDRMDLQPLRAADIPLSAILDLDSTVLDGNVMDPFLAALIEEKLIREEANEGLRQYLMTLEGVDAARVGGASVLKNATLLLDRWSDVNLAPNQKPTGKDMFYAIVGLLRGLTVEEGTRAARLAFDEGTSRFPPRRRQGLADRDGCSMPRLIESMQKKGIRVYVLSATLDLLAREAGRALGIPQDQILGSILEIRDGKFTGKVAASTYYTKGAITRQWLPGPPLLVFGDSPSSDFSMLLEAAGAGFMVNPRAELVQRDQNEAGGRLIEVRFDSVVADLSATP